MDGGPLTIPDELVAELTPGDTAALRLYVATWDPEHRAALAKVSAAVRLQVLREAGEAVRKEAQLRQ